MLFSTFPVSLSRPAIQLWSRQLGSICLVCLFARFAGAAESAPLPAPETKPQFYAVPMHFEANAGQADKSVDYLSRGPGYTVFLTPSQAVLSLRNNSDSSGSRKQRQKNRKNLTQTTFSMKLVGANARSVAEGRDQLPGTVNYFIGNDPAKWRASIPVFAKVKYPQVYPGIDLVYYGNQQQLEYDFVVAPGANPKRIQIAFAGVDKLQLDRQGALVVTVGPNQVRWQPPVAYQSTPAGQTEVATRFVLNSSTQIGFEVASYDATKPLVIDPVISYGTYLGGSGDDFVLGIAADGAGNAYIVGDTTSANFPTTTGAYRTTPVGSNDVVVCKLNAAGTALIYSTYLGGSGIDLSAGIAIDSAGNAYVTGVSDSPNFPMRNAAFSGNAGFNDAFLSKIGPFGTNLLYSTYLGGGSDDGGNAIAVDNSGNAYITGDTYSIGTGNNPFPATQGAYQRNNSGGRDAFIAKFNTLLSGSSSIGYITFLGGNTDEKGEGIAVDGSGNAIVVGEVRDNTTVPPSLPSSDFPIANAFQSTFNRGITDPYTAGYSDGFMTKLNASGTGLIFSTFLGGAFDDCASAVTIDNTGKIFVLGETSSTNFPVLNAAQPTIGGGVDNDFPAQDAFISEFQSNGTALVYSTYIGGSGYESGFQTYRSGIAVDRFGYIYAAGWTDSIDDFPLTFGADQTNALGQSDAWVAKINPIISGPASLIYSSFLGGDGDDRATCLAVNTNGLVYVGGFTSSITNFPTTPGVVRPNHSGGFYDGWIAKLTPPADISVSIIASTNPVIIGTNLTLTIQVNNNSSFVFSQVTNTLQIATNFSIVSVATPPLGNVVTNGNNLIFNLGTLSNNLSLVQTVVLATTSPGLTTNIATLTSIETPILEPNTGNNVSTLIENIRGAADVTLVQSAPSQVFVSSNLVYTIGITNKGFWAASALSFSDALPASLSFVSASVSPTNQGTCVTNGQIVSCDLGTLAKGAGATITIVTIPTASGNINNTATISEFEVDPNLANNSASSGTTVNALSDLLLAQIASTNQVYAGSNLTYTLFVTNLGPSSSTGILLSDPLPAGASLISTAPSAGGTVSNNAGVVYCSWPSLANNGFASLGITVRPTAGGQMTNTASVTSQIPDPTLGNNSSSLAVTVIAAADLALSQTANPNNVQVSSNVTFTIVLTNRGPSSAANVVVTDPLPPGFSFISAQSTQGIISQGSGIVTCSIANFANNASATITIVARPGLDGVFQNIASVSSSTADLNPNNSASASVTVTENPNAPVLRITQVGTNVVLSWSTNAGGFRLQVAPVMSANPAWADVTNVPVVVGKQYMVTNAIGSGSFYRLVETPVSLSATMTTPNSVVVSWPALAPGGVLKRANTLLSNAVWTTVAVAPVLANNRYYVTNPVTTGGNYFKLYR